MNVTCASIEQCCRNVSQWVWEAAVDLYERIAEIVKQCIAWVASWFCEQPQETPGDSVFANLTIPDDKLVACTKSIKVAQLRKNDVVYSNDLGVLGPRLFRVAPHAEAESLYILTPLYGSWRNDYFLGTDGLFWYACPQMQIAPTWRTARFYHVNEERLLQSSAQARQGARTSIYDTKRFPRDISNLVADYAATDTSEAVIARIEGRKCS